MLWLVQTDVIESLSPSSTRTRTLSSWVTLERVPEESLSQMTRLMGNCLFRGWQGEDTSVRMILVISPDRRMSQSKGQCFESDTPTA